MGGLCAQGDTECVDVDLPLDLLGRDGVDPARVQDAGVVVQDVEGATGVRGELGQRVGPLLRFTDVERARDPVGMVGLDLREGVGIDVVARPLRR